MKKTSIKKIFCLMIFALILGKIPASDFDSLRTKFVKGNISDKIETVKLSKENDSIQITKMSLDFIIENVNFLNEDRDLCALTVATILTLPSDSEVLNKNFPTIKQDLITFFNCFTDETVRISVLEKFKQIGKDSEDICEILNNFILNQNSSSQIVKKTFECLGLIGNGDSFYILWNAWKNNKFNEYQESLENALIALSQRNLPETIKVISEATISEIYQFIKIVQKNKEIPLNFKAEIAENALSSAIHNTEDNSKNFEDSVNLQLECIKLISEANWTRSNQLVITYFSVAKKDFNEERMTSDQFIVVIDCLTNLASTQSAKTLSDYLAEINSKIESKTPFCQDVVIAVIKSLGVLGDKTAFDNLLYVTYLDYSEEVKNLARESLAKLKW